MVGRNRMLEQEPVILQWASGRIEARLQLGKGDFAPHVGWYAEVGQSDAFDHFAEQAGVSQMEVRHGRLGRPVYTVRHWNLGDVIRFFPLTRGPVARTVAVSIAGNYLFQTADAGIGVRWVRDEGRRSHLAIRGYLQIYTSSGMWMTYYHLAQISVRSRMSDALLSALADHVRVCEIADNMIERGTHADLVSCYELALPLGPGEEELWGKSETSMITPIACLHPMRDITEHYLRTIWRPDQIAVCAQRDWESVQAWARNFCSQKDRDSNPSVASVASSLLEIDDLSA